MIWIRESTSLMFYEHICKFIFILLSSIADIDSWLMLIKHLENKYILKKVMYLAQKKTLQSGNYIRNITGGHNSHL